MPAIRTERTQRRMRPYVHAFDHLSRHEKSRRVRRVLDTLHTASNGDSRALLHHAQKHSPRAARLLRRATFEPTLNPLIESNKELHRATPRGRCAAVLALLPESMQPATLHVLSFRFSNDQYALSRQLRREGSYSPRRPSPPRHSTSEETRALVQSYL